MLNKQLIFSIGTIILMAVFFTNNNIFIEMITGMPLIIGLVWSIITIQRSNVDSRIKRNSLITIVVILSIIGRLYIQIVK